MIRECTSLPLRVLLTLAVVAGLLLGARRASAEPIRLLLVVAHRDGLAGEGQLHHPDDDARAVHRLFLEVGGVRPADAELLLEPTPEALVAAFARLRQSAAGHPASEVTLVVYFSGHGDREAVHLGARAVPLRELASEVQRVGAGLSLVVIDACRVALPGTRSKGVSAEPGFALSFTAPAATGTVWLHASRDGEVAQESDELGGAVFTHDWVDGLRGAADANGDQRVTLGESYDFASSQTLLRSARSAEGGGALQRPEVTFDLEQSAAIVLTRLAHDAGFTFPPGTDAQYLVYSVSSRALVGEIWSHPDHPVRLALPRGHYLVQRRAPGANGALTRTLAAGEMRSLAPLDFVPFAAATLAQKGAGVVVWPNQLSVASGLSVSNLPAHGALLGLRYARALGQWAVSAGVAGEVGAGSTAAEDLHVDELAASARVEWRPRLVGASPAVDFELHLGGGPRIAEIFQRLQRTDAARVMLAGYPTASSEHATAAGVEAVVGIGWWFSRRASLALDAVPFLLGVCATPQTPGGRAGAASSVVPYAGLSALVSVRLDL
jgi:hypothetical protein